ncbi:MAG TPA: hypothetical protein VMU53_07795 [Candidatus Sulfotelmatobacter sp.]|nr:hypothetical protein [Candidatus Sulfotelmatobacter sp.]
MKFNCLLVACFALAASFGAAVWDKSPDKWSLSDVYRILEDSPWSPAKVKLEAKSAPRQEDSQAGPIQGPIDSNETSSAPGMQISRTKPEADIPVIWWSSKTIRLAEQRLRQLRNPSSAKQPLRVDDLPDYVLVVEGAEPVGILQDAKEDLHDTVFLELSDGTTLDLASVRFTEGPEGEPRAEFHFPKQVDGQPTLDPNSDRVILHCRATAKAPRPFEENSVALRADFKLQTMKVRGIPDL